MTITNSCQDELIDWNLILQFKELHSYLSTNEILKLSEISKLLNIKLKYLTLSKFNLSTATCIKKLKNLLNTNKFLIDESFQYVARFTREVYIASQSPTNSLSTLFDQFNNINSLSLWYIDIKLSQINLVLENLNLRELALSRININIKVCKNSMGTSIDLIVPTKNLHRLVLESCTSVIDDSNIPHGLQIRGIQLATSPYFNMSNLYYPNLRYLVVSRMNTNEDHLLNNFIYNNPRLKSLQLKMNECNQQTFSLISDLNQLKTVVFINRRGDLNLRNISFSQINTIKTLSFKRIKFDNTWESIAQFCQHCNGVENLKLYYYKPNQFYINSILASLKSLRTLSLVNLQDCDTLMALDPANSISHLRLTNFNTFKIDFIALQTWRSLERVSIKVSNPSSNIFKIIGNFKTWRVILYDDDDLVQLFKVN